MLQKWRSKFTNSQRSLEEARSELKFKTDSIHSLESRIEALENDFRKDLQAAKEKLGNHNKCKKEIDFLKEAMVLKEAELEKSKREFEEHVKHMENKIEVMMKENEERLKEQEGIYKSEKEAMLKEVRNYLQTN